LEIGSDGARYAEVAAMWGATLMVAEICKLGLSASDRRARVLFNAQDKLFNQANKMLSIVGKGKIASKADILKTLDPELRGVNQMTDAVQKARRFLRSTGVVENKETKLVLDLAVELTQDTLLIMQAMNLQQAASSNTTRTQAKMRESLEGQPKTSHY
jgi:putative protein kinase ArgK-like GTPase of G3E family